MAKDIFLGDVMLDKVMRVVVSLARELYVAKDRINVLEQLLYDRGTLARDAIETYKPTPEQEQQWLAMRDAYIERVLRPLIDDDSKQANPGEFER